jgi:hypothetical protein
MRLWQSRTGQQAGKTEFDHAFGDAKMTTARPLDPPL